MGVGNVGDFQKLFFERFYVVMQYTTACGLSMISKIFCGCEIKISEVSALYASFVEAGFQFCTEHVCLLVAKPTVVYKKLEKGCYGTLFHAGFSRPYATGKASVAQQLGVKISVRHLFLSSFFSEIPGFRASAGDFHPAVRIGKVWTDGG